MEKRLNQFDKIVSDFIGDSGMAFSVIDNINIYRGTVTHFRIFKKLGPKMWNFTGRYLFKPHLDNIDPALFANREMWMDPQKPLNRVTVEDVLIGKVFNNSPLIFIFISIAQNKDNIVL